MDVAQPIGPSDNIFQPRTAPLAIERRKKVVKEWAAEFKLDE
jgi:hypothetical protein